MDLYSDHPRLFPKIWAIPGVRRHQTGDHEMRATFPPEALEQVPALIRAKRWAEVGEDAPRIWSQTPDNRVLRRPRMASRRPARLWTWVCAEEDPGGCPCYPDRASAREGPGMKCPPCRQDNPSSTVEGWPPVVAPGARVSPCLRSGDRCRGDTPGLLRPPRLLHLHDDAE